MVSLTQYMALFYTGKGDRGTSKIGKKNYPKDSLLLEALGELDELNSLLGVVRAQAQDAKLQEKIAQIQETLFIIQARIAWIMFPRFKEPQLPSDKIKKLEHEIAAIEKKIKPRPTFIVPGSFLLSAWLDLARAVSRRIERRIYSLSKKQQVPKEVIAYCNRLSSYLYALARHQAWQNNIQEKNPTYR